MQALVDMAPEDASAVFDRDTLSIHDLRIDLESASDDQRRGIATRMVESLTRLMALDQRGQIFLPIHLRTYRGVAFIYLNKFDLAVQDLMPMLGNHSIESSFNSVDDTEEFYNPEMLYNLMLCFVLQRKFGEALEIAEELVKR
jgi:hypothetical protein